MWFSSTVRVLFLFEYFQRVVHRKRSSKEIRVLRGHVAREARTRETGGSSETQSAIARDQVYKYNVLADDVFLVTPGFESCLSKIFSPVIFLHSNGRQYLNDISDAVNA